MFHLIVDVHFVSSTHEIISRPHTCADDAMDEIHKTQTNFLNNSQNIYLPYSLFIWFKN